MAWAVPLYSRGRVDAAGVVLASNEVSLDETNTALEILNNWRASHSYPLNTFQMALRRKARVADPESLVVQRLKRVPSIVQKLQRYPGMKLSRMQDIGGCRAVVQTVEQTEILRSFYRTSRHRHQLVGEKDYITYPKTSGYRGIHLIYRHVSNRSEYDNLLVELQFRSKLQHAWATAVETVGTFLSQSLKSSEGPDAWLQFFAHAASAFAIVEGTSGVPGTPDTRAELLPLLTTWARQLSVRDTLQAYRVTLRYAAQQERANAHFFLLALKPQSQTLTVETYRKEELDRATREYLQVEKELAEFPGAQAVLVVADSLDALRRSYPNYFLDTQVFVSAMQDFVSAAGR